MGACQKDTTERAPNGKSKTFKAKNKVVLNHNTKYKIPKSYWYKWYISDRSNKQNKQISLAGKCQITYVNKHPQGGGQCPTF